MSVEIVIPTNDSQQYEKDYATTLRKEFSKNCDVELLTLNDSGNAKITVSISDIYVDVTCLPYPYHDGCEAEPSLSKFKSCKKNVVVLGMPGSGKSMLIKRLYYECLQEDFQNVNNVYTIPIYIELKNEFQDRQSCFCEITNSNVYIGIALKNYVNDKLNDLNTYMLGDKLYAQIQREGAQIRYNFYCDGLDEISLEQSELFNTTVVKLAKKLNYVKFYISSRYQGYKNSDYSDGLFEKFSLRDFGLVQENEYVKKYFTLIGEENSPNKEILLNTLGQDTTLQEMAKSPILLSLLCISNDVQSVKDRTELFDKAITTLLNHRQIVGDKAKETRDFLQKIAVSFFKQDRLEKFEKDEVFFYLKNDNTFLKCGLFDETGDFIKFHHRTIWEYLVAEGLSGDKHCNEIYERANMTAWAVPIRMWVLIYTKNNTDEPDKIYAMFCELWKRNKALTLECLSEYMNSSKILDNLYRSMHKKQKLRLISTLREAYINAPDYKEQAVNTIVKSLHLIHDIEKQYGKDCEVIYEYVSFLEEFIRENEFRKLLTEILEFDTINDRLEKLKKAGLMFIPIKAGVFEMGRDRFKVPEGSVKGKYISIDEEEVPKHKVRISQDFEMSQTLITNEMFYLCDFPFASDAHNIDIETGKFKNSYCSEKGHPVNYITWYEAIMFAKWLKCTLPTEAEWEYACRGYGCDCNVNEDALCIVMEQDKLREYLRGGAGQDNDYSTMRAHYSYAGNTTMPRLIFDGDEKVIDPQDIRRNSLGLIDMLGNLREWCLDWFGEDFYKKCDIKSYPNFSQDIDGKETVTYYFCEKNEICILKDGEHVDTDMFTFDKDGYCIDPVKKYVELTESKCIRGGCFDWNVTNLRPTYRNHNPATNIYKVNGFRIVKKSS